MPTHPGQISEAAGSMVNLPQQAQPLTLRQRLMSAWDQIAGNGGSPLEQQYNPLQALNIGAGAASSAAVNQAKQLFQQGSGYLAERGGMPEEAARMRGLADETRQAGQDAGALYQPMQEAFPYSTAVGEAAPALVPGGMAAARSAATFNVGRAYLDEVAKATQSARLQALAQALRRY